MLLEGSCSCGACRFSVTSAHPYPYQRCYCSICRKTQGGGGYAVNLAADAASLRVRNGRQHIRLFHARILNPEDSRSRTSTGERHFCDQCGTCLWLFSPEWPELLHPFASAIDTPLPVPLEITHIMLEFKAPWVEVNAGPGDRCFDRYPEESIAGWHDRLGLATP